MVEHQGKHLQAFTTRLDGRLIRATKMHSAKTGMTVQVIVDEALRRLLEETARPTSSRRPTPRLPRDVGRNA